MIDFKKDIYFSNKGIKLIGYIDDEENNDVLGKIIQHLILSDYINYLCPFDIYYFVNGYDNYIHEDLNYSITNESYWKIIEFEDFFNEILNEEFNYIVKCNNLEEIKFVKNKEGITIGVNLEGYNLNDFNHVIDTNISAVLKTLLSSQKSKNVMDVFIGEIKKILNYWRILSNKNSYYIKPKTNNIYN